MNESTVSTALGALVVLAVGIGLVNYLKDRSGPTPAITPATQTETGKVTLPSTHKVEQGEHLWKISEKYYQSGYNWVDIAKANNITNPNLIAIGQDLTIPQVEAKTVTATNEEARPNAPPEQVSQATSIQGDSYTIVKGDNLWEISVRAYGDGYKWTQLAKTNNLKNPNLIYPEQKLSLPR